MVRKLHLANEDVFIGGPLASNAMFVIHSSEYFIDKKTIKVCEEISVTGSKEITDDIQKREGPKKHFTCYLAGRQDNWRMKL